jgi:ABC-type antimicrobial peptide transport system permease subunit
MELILEKLNNVKSAVDEIKKKLEKDYVTQWQLDNLKDKVSLLQRIVFWFVSLILVWVVTALLSLVILK